MSKAKFLLAKQIIEKLKRVVLTANYDHSDPVIQKLFQLDRDLTVDNDKIINEIIYDYAQTVQVGGFMNLNTKLEIAVDIMAKTIANAVKQGYGVDGEILKQLLFEREEMYKCNQEVLDKIINVYGRKINSEEVI